MQNLNALFGVAYREMRRFSVPQLGYSGYQNILKMYRTVLRQPIPDSEFFVHEPPGV
jgi:hypothetical protein